MESDPSVIILGVSLGEITVNPFGEPRLPFFFTMNFCLKDLRFISWLTHFSALCSEEVEEAMTSGVVGSSLGGRLLRGVLGGLSSTTSIAEVSSNPGSSKDERLRG